MTNNKNIANQKKNEALRSISKSFPLPNPSPEDIGKTFDVWKSAKSETDVTNQSPSNSPSKSKETVRLF